MRVLVTGAGGFVGRSIVDELTKCGHDVIAVDLAFDADLRDQWAGTVEMIENDLCNLGQAAFDAYIHAAAVTTSPADSSISPVNVLRGNVESTLDLLDIVRPHQRGVLVSSSGIFYRTPFGPLTEDDLPSPRGMYAVAKRLIEDTANSMRQDFGYDICAVRLGYIYGPGEHRRATRPRLSNIAQILDEAATESVIRVRHPEEPRSWTFSPDVGRALETMLTAPTLDHALYHIGSEEVLTNQAVAETIAKWFPKAEIVHDTSVETSRNTKGYLSSQRLRSELGFDSWTPFEDGIRQIVDAMRVRG